MSRIFCNSISTFHLQQRGILLWLLTMVLFATSLAVPAYASVYSDAEEGIADWQAYDNKPVGASIENVQDDERNSRVMQLTGDAQQNAFLIGIYDDRAPDSFDADASSDET